MSTGWSLSSAVAPYPRDCLLPAPSAALTSCLRTELGYDATYALQRRLMSLLIDVNGFPLARNIPHCWTLHSCRIFCRAPPQTALGRWAVESSDRPKSATQNPSQAAGGLSTNSRTSCWRSSGCSCDGYSASRVHVLAQSSSNYRIGRTRCLMSQRSSRIFWSRIQHFMSRCSSR